MLLLYNTTYTSRESGDFVNNLKDYANTGVETDYRTYLKNQNCTGCPKDRHLEQLKLILGTASESLHK